MQKKGEVPRTEIFQKQMENLVKDTHCPGMIEETMTGKENFNVAAFKLALGYSPCDKPKSCPPTEEPFTYLQAFAMRIDLEREGAKVNLQKDATAEQ